MAKRILAVSSRPSNLVSHLAYLIGKVLHERCDRPSDSHIGYRRVLSTLIGLGFTAIIADGKRVHQYRRHMSTFLRYCDFAQHAGKLSFLAKAVAEIVCAAIPRFSVLGHPIYYDDFIKALPLALQSSNKVDAKTLNEAQLMLQDLFEKYS